MREFIFIFRRTGTCRRRDMQIGEIEIRGLAENDSGLKPGRDFQRVDLVMEARFGPWLN